jgi:hypothetical protein
MADKDYNVYQGDDGKWRGERQDASRASVVAECSGQVKLATDLYSSQYLFSDSLGVNPPL